MKTISGMMYLFCLSALIILGGCGGGGSSSPSSPAATKAVVKLSTQGTLPAGTQLAGVAVKITLPAGVTVATDSSGAVLSSVVNVSGVAAAGGVTTVGPVTYTPATASAAGTLEFTIAASNFGTGEFATVNFVLASGATVPTTSNLNVTITPADQTLRPVTSLSVALSIQVS